MRVVSRIVTFLLIGDVLKREVEPRQSERAVCQRLSRASNVSQTVTE
jgi:hypothetical protein